MTAALAALLFLAVAGVTAWLGLRPRRRRSGVERLVEAPAGERTPASAGLAWRELAERVGSVAPMSPGDAPLLKRRLIRAGFRGPLAARTFHGARAIATPLVGAAAALAAWRSGAAADNVALAAAAGAALGYMLPMQYVLLRLRRRQRAIERGLPNALDLMVVCVESGLGLDQATIQVAKELQFAYPDICDEFALMNLELRAGKRRVEALHNLAARTAVEDLRKLVAVLVQTDRFGTSVAQTLRGHADYMRVMARQRAEERAAKLAVKLVFPIFFCVLPSLFVVTVGPVLTKLIRDLLPMIDRM